MIETKEQYEHDVHDFRQLQPLRTKRLEETIEALRPFLRFMREERIVPIGSHVTGCTYCHTSWLTDPPNTYPGQEHHETTCLLYGIPRWLGETESQDETN